jgi:hypothetical protein
VRCACTERGKTTAMQNLRFQKGRRAARQHAQKARLEAAGDEMGEK